MLWALWILVGLVAIKIIGDWNFHYDLKTLITDISASLGDSTVENQRMLIASHDLLEAIDGRLRDIQYETAKQIEYRLIKIHTELEVYHRNK